MANTALAMELWGCPGCNFGAKPCDCIVQREGVPDPVPTSSAGCPYCKHGREPCVCPRGHTPMQTAESCAVLANIMVGVEEGVIAEADMILLPQHYARFKIEPIRFSVENNLNVFQMNILKYILRHDAKDGLQDLRKARRYLDMFIKFVEGDPNWWRKDA